MFWTVLSRGPPAAAFLTSSDVMSVGLWRVSGSPHPQFKHMVCLLVSPGGRLYHRQMERRLASRGWPTALRIPADVRHPSRFSGRRCGGEYRRPISGPIGSPRARADPHAQRRVFRAAAHGVVAVVVGHGDRPGAARLDRLGGLSRAGAPHTVVRALRPPYRGAPVHPRGHPAAPDRVGRLPTLPPP